MGQKSEVTSTTHVKWDDERDKLINNLLILSLHQNVGGDKDKVQIFLSNERVKSDKDHFNTMSSLCILPLKLLVGY